MKTQILSLAILTLLFLVTSCNKDNYLTDVSQELEKYTGEDLPETYTSEDPMVLEMKEKVYRDFKKEAEIQDIEWNVSKSMTRSKTITDITCGNKAYGTTINESNSIEIYYNKPDKIYSFTLTQKDEVTVKLSKLNSDLDLFIYEELIDNYGRRYPGSKLYTSDEPGTNEEIITEMLNAGDYLIIVETYEVESDFTLEVNCKNKPSNNPRRWCENFDDLRASYIEGISLQSPHWHLWKGLSNDGKVLFETSNTSNKVVKFDYARFGYQDVVRELTGLTPSSGWYIMNFKLWVAQDKRADFVTEKTNKDGQEQGFGISIQAGVLSVKYKGNTYTAAAKVKQNKWIRCSISFDLTYNLIVARIDNVSIILRADARIDSYGNSRKSIHGINFYGNKYATKFHVDDVCITEIESGFGDPLRVYTITDSEDTEIVETLDLSKED